RIGLAGQRKWRGTLLAYAAGGEMAVDDGVDLVGALRRLIDALRIERDRARRGREHPEEGRDIGFREAGCESSRTEACRDVFRLRQRLVETVSMRRDIVAIQR